MNHIEMLSLLWTTSGILICSIYLFTFIKKIIKITHFLKTLNENFDKTHTKIFLHNKEHGKITFPEKSFSVFPVEYIYFNFIHFENTLHKTFHFNFNIFLYFSQKRNSWIKIKQWWKERIKINRTQFLFTYNLHNTFFYLKKILSLTENLLI